MDERLLIKDAPRAVPAGVTADVPLVTLGWRALRAEHQWRAQERSQHAAELKNLLEALTVVAEAAYRLRRLAAAQPAAVTEPQPALLPTAERLEEALAKAEIYILSPLGEPYAAELMELLDNVAQQPQPEVLEPYVAEVIAPAIVYRDTVLQMGKAVIAVPADPNEATLANAEG